MESKTLTEITQWALVEPASYNPLDFPLQRRDRIDLNALPPEIRQLIVQHLFPSTIKAALPSLSWPNVENCTAILSVNKLLHNDAVRALYLQTPFQVVISANFIKVFGKIFERYPARDPDAPSLSTLQDNSMLKNLARKIRNWHVVLEMQIPHHAFVPWPPEMQLGGSGERKRLYGLKDSVKKFVGLIERPMIEQEWTYQTMRFEVDETIDPVWTAEDANAGVEFVLEPFKRLFAVKSTSLSKTFVQSMVPHGKILKQTETRRFEEFRKTFELELQRTESAPTVKKIMRGEYPERQAGIETIKLD